MRVRWIGVAGLFVLLLAIAGCRSAKDDPTGIILVGSPEVSTRERLVNDRLTQDGWLRKQLEASDGVSFDDFQGLLDERMLTALSVNASINANPNDLAIHNAESASRLQSVGQTSELSALDHQIAVLEKQNRIAQLRQTGTQAASNTADDAADDAADTGGTGNAGTGQSVTTPSRPSVAAKDLSEELLDRLASETRAKLPDPTAIATTKAKSSPIEALRDRLAYREEIRNEILENQLDDRHDLAGNTLYRLNLDATMIPSAGNSAWGIVDVVVENDENHQRAADLYAEWVPSFQRHFEREINAQFVRTLRCLGDLSASVPSAAKCGLGTGEMEELLAFGSGTTGRYSTRIEDSPARARSYEQQVQMDLRALLRAIAGPDASRQRQELELLIAKKVRSDYFDYSRLGAYLSPPAIGDENCTRVARPGRVVTWCNTGPDLRTPQPGSPHYNCVIGNHVKDATRDLREIRFQCAVGAAWHVYAYSATPKDSVQRISRVAAARNTLEFAAAISALTGAASIDAATAFIRDNQRLMQTILREPLVVGYTEAGRDDGTAPGKAQFGWLIGPRFGLDQKPFRREQVNMDHRPIQNSLAAAISIPGWSNRAKVTVRTCWKSKRSIQGNSASRCGGKDVLDERPYFVELPGRIDAIHNLLVRRADPMPLGWESYEVVTGLPAALLIKGSNLWRSTEVTLGAQTADEIRVLPDMTGIIARFDAVKETASLDGAAPRTVEVNIWTSGGNRAVGEARIYPRKKDDVTWKIAWRQPRVIKDEEVAIDMLQGTLPTSFAKMELVAEGFDASKAKWTEPIRLTGTTRGNAVHAKMSDGGVLTTGMEVRGSIWTLLRPDSVAVDSKATAEGTAIYYASAAEAKVQTPANLKSGGKLTLTFPKRVAHAYPGFQRPSVTASATPAALAASLSAPTWTTNANGQDVLEYVVTITGTIDPAASPKLVLKVVPLPDGLLMDKTEIPLIP